MTFTCILYSDSCLSICGIVRCLRDNELPGLRSTNMRLKSSRYQFLLQPVLLLGLLRYHVGLCQFGLQQLLLQISVLEDLLQVLQSSQIKSLTSRTPTAQLAFSAWGDQYRLSLVVFWNETLELLSQGAVLLAQLAVAVAVLLDLGLDVAQRSLEVRGDLLPLQVVLSAPLQRLLLSLRRKTGVNNLLQTQTWRGRFHLLFFFFFLSIWCHNMIWALSKVTEVER